MGPGGFTLVYFSTDHITGYRINIENYILEIYYIIFARYKNAQCILVDFISFYISDFSHYMTISWFSENEVESHVIGLLISVFWDRFHENKLMKVEPQYKIQQMKL